MKKKIVALGIVSMFLLVSTISSSAVNNSGIKPAGLVDKYIKGEGELGIAFNTTNVLFALAKHDTTIKLTYNYDILPENIIEKNVSFVILLLFDGSLVKPGDETFSFEGNCWLIIAK